MKLYKLTDENGCSYNLTQWGENVTHEGTGEGDLCGPGWIHAYTSPLLAVLLNPIHGDFADLQLWEAEGNVSKKEHGLKVGCKRLTTLKRIPLPEITTTQKVAFGILCTFGLPYGEKWRKWADDWLTGKDRTEAAARRAQAPWAAAAKVLSLVAIAAAEAAAAAALAARRAPQAAARRVAWAAWAAQSQQADLNLESIAQQAMKY